MNDQIILNNACLVEPHYFPTIEYIYLLKAFPDIVFDLNSPFKKSTYLNRTYIVSANKVQVLSIPVQHGRHNHLPIKEVKILYDENWPKQHLTAINSAYGRSSYYMYYRDAFEHIWNKQHVFLADLIHDTTCLLLKHLLSNTTCHSTDNTRDYNGVTDLRGKINPQSREQYIHSPYYQVFEHKHGFQNNVSAVDLLFNLGPDAAGYVQKML